MATTTVEKHAVHVGTIKQINENGPAYEVVEEPQNDKLFVRVKLVETGEEFDYPKLQVLRDQDAR